MKIRFFLVLFFLILSQKYSFASSSYVLPYPGHMPGNKLYIVDQAIDKVQHFLSFGNISQFKQHLAVSDRYLVEAKTLFEYKQYKLAMTSLQKSDENFVKLYPLLKKSQKQGVNTEDKEKLLTEASVRHREVLIELLLKTPSEFTWEDERSQPVKLQIHKKINNSIKLHR